MVSRINFAKRFRINEDLMRYDGIFAIESMLTTDLVYCFSGEKFAVIRSDGALFCPLREIPKLADMLVSEVRQEILEIWSHYEKQMLRM